MAEIWMGIATGVALLEALSCKSPKAAVLPWCRLGDYSPPKRLKNIMFLNLF